MSEVFQIERQNLLRAPASSSERKNEADVIVNFARSVQCFWKAVKFKLSIATIKMSLTSC